MSWTAVILAGSRGAADPVAQASRVSHKAFAEIAGKPMVAHVLDTMAASPSVGETIVVVERSAPEMPRPDVRRIDAEPSPSLSALAGFETAGAPVIVTTADHPLLTVDMVEHFLAEAQDLEVDVAAGIAFRPIVEQAGSTGRRTYLRFSDGEASGCNLFALMTPRAKVVLTYWRKLEGKRKHPLQLAWSVGHQCKQIAGWIDRAPHLSSVQGWRGEWLQSVCIDDPPGQGGADLLAETGGQAQAPAAIGLQFPSIWSSIF